MSGGLSSVAEAGAVSSSMLRIALAVLHLLGFGIGLGSVFARARAMNDLAKPGALGRGLIADNWWGVSAVMLITTGLWRAIGSIEKTSSYYWTNRAFMGKMSLLGLILLLELWPMITLIRWRVAKRRGSLPVPEALAPTGKRIARISDIQTLLLVGMVVAATMMARGFGTR